jgi:hypothetical protein
MKNFAFINLGIYLTLWYDNLNSRILIGKESYINDLLDANDAFSYARSLTFFGCPYFVIIYRLGSLK